VDEQVLARLCALEQQLANIANVAGMLPGRTKEMGDLLGSLAEGRGYVLPEDKDKFRVLIRRLSGAAANWTDEEKNTLVDTFENLGCYVIKVKKKLNRIYWLVASAGVITVLVQVGAPLWVQKLCGLLMGQ
jgi:hypothetical protein